MSQTAYVHQDPTAGARNLLVNCAAALPGERLLIAFESDHHGYFDADVVAIIKAEAVSLGLRVDMTDVGFQPRCQGLPDHVLAQIGRQDIVLFLSRLGDQLRFATLPEGPRYVVCFTSNRHLLGSAFGCADYAAFCQVKQAIDHAIHTAEEIVVTCANGTHVTGRVANTGAAPQDTTARRFPMSVFSPVTADLFSGRVALGGFLTGTGSHYYDQYSIEFDGPLFAWLQEGKLTGFDGAPQDVARADAHYDRVAQTFGIERNSVHSWHAGIHPGCGFPWDLRQNYELWGGAAFGNPRVLHFHTCGAYPPGEIAWNVIDPTIALDGVRLWEDGHLRLERLDAGARIMGAYPDLEPLFANPDRDIGLGDVH